MIFAERKTIDFNIVNLDGIQVPQDYPPCRPALFMIRRYISYTDTVVIVAKEIRGLFTFVIL